MPYVGQSVTDFFDEGARAVTRETSRRMCDEGVRNIKRVAAMNTPVRSGRLRAAWEVTEAKASVQDGDDVGFRAEVYNDTPYAGDVENGTGLWGPKHAPYVILPRHPNGFLRFVTRDGRVVFAKKVVHPGSPGNYMLAIGLNVTEALAQTGSIFVGPLEMWVREMEAQARK